MRKYVASGFSPGFPELSRSCRQVAHVLLTRPPLVPQALTPKGDCLLHALDLHVLGTPPAFVLSQDQTLQKSLPRLTPINHGSLNYFKLISGSIIRQMTVDRLPLTSVPYWLFCSVFKEQISFAIPIEGKKYHSTYCCICQQFMTRIYIIRCRVFNSKIYITRYST